VAEDATGEEEDRTAPDGTLTPRAGMRLLGRWPVAAAAPTDCCAAARAARNAAVAADFTESRSEAAGGAVVDCVPTRTVGGGNCNFFPKFGCVALRIALPLTCCRGGVDVGCKCSREAATEAGGGDNERCEEPDRERGGCEVRCVVLRAGEVGAALAA
jgi:hypothetical protein